MYLPTQIETPVDVQNFINYLLLEEKLNFHPDTPFSDYVAYVDNKPTYTPDQCAERECLLDQCFALVGDAIYDVGFELQCELIGLPPPECEKDEQAAPTE